MRLTSLTLHGFKSFGDRTTVEFSPRVTAVVGPNGSGKSNIIDALRWASGGGRAKEFRADEKTDLIFHGAAGRKGVSYAEVELELKGTSGRLHIARNLFRDGQTKLLLNGQNARFLDLDDALSGSGLGRGGLALIGQGEVSGVLMADPATLLGYVAEAAGVAKLSARRDGAEARLGAARDHLERLEDILRELRAQVARLEAEAKEAARAASLNREVLHLRYTGSVQRVEALETELGALREKAAEARGVVAAGRDALQAAQARLREARHILGEREETYRRAVGEAEARRGDLRVAQERLRGAQARLGALRREAASLAEEIAALGAAPPPTPPEGDDAALHAAVVRAQEGAANAERAVRTAADALSAQTRRLESARAAEAEKARALAVYKSQRQTLEAQLDEVRDRLGALPDVNPERVTTLENEVAAAREALRGAEAAERRARGGLETVQRDHANAHAEALALERARARSRSAFEARQGYTHGPRQALTSGLPGVIGSVADLLRVPEAYEVAASSALGRRAENVVVEDAEVAQAVLVHLKRVGGWATLLPLELVSGRATALGTLQNAPGVVGLLLDLVAFEARYAGVFAALLGNTVVVTSTEAAVALARAHALRPRLVTLGGDLLETSGAVTGGKRQMNTGLLGAAAELEETERAAEGALGEAARLKESVVAAQEAFKKNAREVVMFREMLGRIQTALTEAQGALATRRSRADELERLGRTLQTQLDALVSPGVKEETEEAAKDTVGEADLPALERAQEAARAAREAATQEREASARRLYEAQGALGVFRERAGAFEGAQVRFEEGRARLEALRGRAAVLAAEREAQEGAQAALTEALQRAEAALPRDLPQVEAAYAEARLEGEAAEEALTKESGAQAARAAEAENLALTLARRETTLEGAVGELAAFPAGLPLLDGSPRTLRERLASAERELASIGPVNHRAQNDWEKERARLDALSAEGAEAAAAVDELGTLLHNIDAETSRRLGEALTRLRTAFAHHAKGLFGPEAVADIEVEHAEGRPVGLKIALQPPGKRTRALNLLSVGERTMGALAFLFSLTGEREARGLPIAILDEVDAPLDEANIRRFCAFVESLAGAGTQFVLITHQKATMEAADTLWGVTTERGVSRVFSISKTTDEKMVDGAVKGVALTR